MTRSELDALSLTYRRAYTDPDPAQGTYQVMRIAPYESH